MKGAKLPRAYWVLWSAVLVNRLGAFVVPLLYLYLTQSERMSVAGASFVVALYGIGSTLSGPVGGLLADHLGRRTTLVGSLVLGAAGMVALGLTHAPGLIPVLAFLLGFAGELHRPAASAAIADLVPLESRVKAYGLLHWATNLGFGFALLVAGWMAQHHFLWLFLGDAATTLLCAGIIWRWVPESRPERPREAARVLAGLYLPLKDRRFAPLWLLALLTTTLYFQFTTSVPETLTRHGEGTVGYGTLVAVTCFLVTLVQPLATPFLQRAPRPLVLLGAVLLIGVGFGSLALCSTLPHFLVAGGIWTLGEIAYVAVMPSIVAELAPDAHRGSYQGAYQMAWGLASFAGPAVGGVMLEAAGPNVLWSGCLVVGAVVALGHYAWASRSKPAALPEPG